MANVNVSVLHPPPNAYCFDEYVHNLVNNKQEYIKV